MAVMLYSATAIKVSDEDEDENEQEKGNVILRNDVGYSRESKSTI